jgi:hypothetical protein
MSCSFDTLPLRIGGPFSSRQKALDSLSGSIENPHTLSRLT